MLKKISVEDDEKSVEVGSQVLEGEDERECRPDGGWGGALPRCSEFTLNHHADDDDDVQEQTSPQLSTQLCLSKEGE